MFSVCSCRRSCRRSASRGCWWPSRWRVSLSCWEHWDWFAWFSPPGRNASLRERTAPVNRRSQELGQRWAACSKCLQKKDSSDTRHHDDIMKEAKPTGVAVMSRGTLSKASCAFSGRTVEKNLAFSTKKKAVDYCTSARDIYIYSQCARQKKKSFCLAFLYKYLT